uniref:Uncharacterized protein n=1 Tax=Amphimedon queenslandica TaxID=400682 RepID=A0A1X7SRQ3_AMPQE
MSQTTKHGTIKRKAKKSTAEFATKKKPKIKQGKKGEEARKPSEKREADSSEIILCHSPPPLPPPLALVEHETQAACSTQTGRYSATYMKSNGSTPSAPSACNLPQHTDLVTPTNEPVQAISSNTTVHTGNMRKIDINALLLNPDTVINKYPKIKTLSQVGRSSVRLASKAYFGPSLLIKCSVYGQENHPLPSGALMEMKQKLLGLFHPRDISTKEEF